MNRFGLGSGYLLILSKDPGLVSPTHVTMNNNRVDHFSCYIFLQILLKYKILLANLILLYIESKLLLLFFIEISTSLAHSISTILEN